MSDVDRMVSTYFDKKGLVKKRGSMTNPDAIAGFIKRNKIVGKTVEEIDALVSTAEKLGRGQLLGEGDKFKRWCESNGREVPDDELVMFMNRDPYEAGQHVKRSVGKSPQVWRSWVSFHAGKGRRNV